MGVVMYLRLYVYVCVCVYGGDAELQIKTIYLSIIIWLSITLRYHCLSLFVPIWIS